jgi:tripartite-type tricarboxylate transporter receptor subunit TctC
MATSIAIVVQPGLAQVQQKYPTKPIRLVLGYGVGGQPDTVARMIGPKLSESLGQPVVIENRVGASGALAAVQVAKATPDGHTLLLTAGNFPISAALQPTLPYDPIKDFAGISRIGTGSPQMLVVAPTLGAKSVKDLIALAKARPGKLIFSSPGAVGSGSHLTGARLSLAGGINIVTVAYKVGPEAMLEVLGGRAHYSIATVLTGLSFIKDRQLLALAVFAPQRSSMLSDVPPITETFPEWKRGEFGLGLLAPAKTPPRILNQISKAVARVINQPDFREWMHTVDFTAGTSTPEEYDRFVREQIEIYSKLVRDIGLKTK